MKVRDVLTTPLKGKRGDFSVKDVQRIMDVDAALLQQWLARGLIPSTKKKIGKRTLRRFPLRDLPRLVLIAEIVGHGYTISDAAENVDLILDWKYPEGAIPGPVLWFRQQNLIVFPNVPARGAWALPKWLREQDCASCFLLSIHEIKRKIETALVELDSEQPGTETRGGD